MESLAHCSAATCERRKQIQRDGLLLCLFFQVSGHTRPPRPLPATLFHTSRTHCQGWGHQAFYLKFLCVVTPVAVFVGLCVGVWFYGTAWLTRFHRSFYLPHSSALPSKHKIIKFSKLFAGDNAQKHRKYYNEKWNSVIGVEFDEF